MQHDPMHAKKIPSHLLCSKHSWAIVKLLDSRFKSKVLRLLQLVHSAQPQPAQGAGVDGFEATDVFGRNR